MADILCPNCKWSIISEYEVWCGCKPIPRKKKKLYKKQIRRWK